MHHEGYVSKEVEVLVFFCWQSHFLNTQNTTPSRHHSHFNIRFIYSALEYDIKKTTIMTSLTVKVNRAKLSACLTCLLCNKFFRNATTISECLHTFCRECIYKKLIDEKLKHCPVCNADLGCSPLDKLRTDHSLQDLREKIFPCEGKNAQAPDNVPSVTSLTKRKKNSLSSLNANARRAKAAARKVFTPQESDFSASKPDKVADVKKDEKRCGIEILDEVSTILSARRAKAFARRKFIPRESTPTCQPDKVTGDEKKDDDHSQHKTFNETFKTRVQNSSKPDSSQQIVPNKISEDSAELWKEKADMCEPLNSLVEAARKNKSCNKSTMQENAVIPVPVDSNDNDSQVPKVEVKKHSHLIKAAGDQNESTPSKSDSIKHKRLQGTQERTAKICEDLNVPAQSVIGSDSESNKGSGPIWFSLVASEEKEVGARLPQISSRYLRVKDGSLPVSFIEKYVVKKLGLASETKVEISLRGQPVLSSLQLQNLVEMWLQTLPKNETIQTSVGSSAKDFVMLLSYGLKA